MRRHLPFGTRDRLKFLLLFLALALVAAACTSGGESGDEGEEPAAEPAAPADVTEFPREETLYIGGTQWGPPANFNPLQQGTYATGTVGLVYETLFIYEPLNDELTPWLAESGEWTSDNTYEIKLREGVTWNDGEPFTADDVVFTLFDLPKEVAEVPYSNIAQYLESAEAVDDTTAVFTFSDPVYQQWSRELYFEAMLPRHIWEERMGPDILDEVNENPVGTGAYTYHSHDDTRTVWEKNPDWWATEALDKEVQPTYIVDLVNISNETALGQVLQGEVDLNNNFLPGVSRLVQGGYGISTYYPEAPYMISANTAWIIMNTTKPPMDDPAFRRALAYSVNTGEIVNTVYQQLVTPADPTGLLPVWVDKYTDKQLTEQMGFSYDPDQARSILAEAGYADTNGDGLVEMPNGDPIELTIMVPQGWTDWMESIRVISESAQAVGINLATEFPEDPVRQETRNNGDYDMAIDNNTQIDSTPWQFYDFLFRMPIQETQTVANFGRYENPEAWELVQQLDRTPLDDVQGMSEIIHQLQEVTFTEMPAIPLWYNGMWAQFNDDVWTNWPTAENPTGMPTAWRGYWQRNAINMLTALEPAPPPEG